MRKEINFSYSPKNVRRGVIPLIFGLVISFISVIALGIGLLMGATVSNFQERYTEPQRAKASFVSESTRTEQDCDRRGSGTHRLRDCDTVTYYDCTLEYVFSVNNDPVRVQQESNNSSTTPCLSRYPAEGTIELTIYQAADNPRDFVDTNPNDPLFAIFTAIPVYLGGGGLALGAILLVVGLVKLVRSRKAPEEESAS